MSMYERRAFTPWVLMWESATLEVYLMLAMAYWPPRLGDE